MNHSIKIHQNDDVIVALKDFYKGDVIDGITLLEDIPKAHKFAIRDIQAGENVFKYGAPIGKASCEISRGAWVHTHNIKTNLDTVEEYSYQPAFEQVFTNTSDREVMIYRRKNGDIGIRNELWIVPTVGCVNAVASQIAEMFQAEHFGEEVAVHVFRHTYGCSQMGDDLENTKVSLQAIAKHPNAGGVLVLGLGCENNQISAFRETLGEYDTERILFLETQGLEDEVEEGVNLLDQLYERMRMDQREKGFLSELKFGLECGGSDGFSGITANPMLGVFSDYINSHGGITVLTEVPEMFGAETILMRRARNQEVFDKIVKLINDFKRYYESHNQVVYDNPSPGNKKGGITTLEDKSLGCTQKAGLSQVMDVVYVGETLGTKGLNLLSAPGNDLVATTSLGIVGCQIVLFTTGRGTPFGGFIPTVKISTNTELAEKKKNWIDFDAGRLVGICTMEELLLEFIEMIVRVVNGEQTKNEINDAREIAIFKSGVTL